jgi:glycosyltransferase involved in cell wall biosynthesis
MGVDYDLFHLNNVANESGFERIKNSTLNKVKMFKLGAQLEKYSVCFAEWTEATYYLTKIARARKKSQIPIVARIHNPFSSYLNKVDFSKLDHIITVGETPKKYLKVPESVQISVIPNAIKEEFSNFDISKNLNPNNICTVGINQCRKQIVPAILTLKEIREDLELDIKFNIVGRGGPDEIYVKLLEKKFPWITFTDWIDDIASFYSEHNLYLCHSYYESFGVAMIEAMMCGVIPLANNILIEHDVLPEKQLYYSSYRELRDKIRYYLSLEENTRYEIVNQYKNIAEKKYNPQIISRQILKILENLVR